MALLDFRLALRYVGPALWTRPPEASAFFFSDKNPDYGVEELASRGIPVHKRLLAGVAYRAIDSDGIIAVPESPVFLESHRAEFERLALRVVWHTKKMRSTE